MFIQGSQATYVELSDSNGRKRFLLPTDYATFSKLKNMLTKYPRISLIRRGPASVTSAPDKSELDSIMEIEDIPAKVDCLHRVHMPDHPDTVDNFARFSQELIDLINQESEVEQMETVNEVSSESSSSQSVVTDILRAQMPIPAASSSDSSSSAPKAPASSSNLTETLRAQAAEQKQQSRSRPLAPSSGASSEPSYRSEPWIGHLPRRIGDAHETNVNKQNGEDEDFDLEDYVCKYLEEMYDMLLEVSDQHTSLERKVDAIGIRLIAPQQGTAISGEQLQKWFAEAAGQVGFDEAFKILALRIAGENPDV